MIKNKIVLELQKVYKNNASLLLILLLIGDFVFFILASINELSDFEHYIFKLDSDLSYPEFYQYMKWLWITSMFVYLALKWRTMHFSAWALFFTYLLLDDALGIHENIGGIIANNLTITPPFGLRLQDIGELGVTAIAGLILSSILIWAYMLGSQAFKSISIDIFMLILVLVFFGIFVDMLDIALPIEGKVQGALWFIEDGGEMLVASIICWYVFLVCTLEKGKSTNITRTFLSIIKNRS